MDFRVTIEFRRHAGELNRVSSTWFTARTVGELFSGLTKSLWSAVSELVKWLPSQSQNENDLSNPS